MPRPIDGKEFTQAEAKAMIPQGVAGCGIYIEEKKAWKAKYLHRVTAGFASHTSNWTATWTHQQALFECLAWVWARHQEVDRTCKCPFDLPAFRDA